MVSVEGARRLRRYEHRESVSRFIGLNNELDPDLIRDTEFSELVNFNVTSSKILVKRPGFRVWSSTLFTENTASKILGVYDTGSNVPQIVAATGTTTVASTDGGLSWTVTLSGTRAFLYSVQYNGLLYLVDSTGVAKWNGTTLTAISGSPGGSHLLEFKDRLWVCDGSPSSNLYFSDPGPAGVEIWGVSSVIKIRTGAPGSLVASLPVADRLMLFKTQSVWQLFLAGNLASWQLRVLNTERGAISENCVLSFQGLIYMLSWDGVWRSDGAVFKELTSRVRKYFKKSPLPYRDANTFLSISNRRLFICYRQSSLPPKNGLPQCAYLWYNLDADAWSEMQLSDKVGKWRPKAIFNWYNPGNLPHLTPTLQLVDSWNIDSSDKCGILSLDEDTPADKSFAFNSLARTKIMDFGDIFGMKRGKVFLPELDSTVGALPKITYGRDTELSDIELPAGSLYVKNPKIYRVTGPGYFRQLETLIEESTTAPMRILTLNWIIMVKAVVGRDT